jgi:hypothetical protein
VPGIHPNGDAISVLVIFAVLIVVLFLLPRRSK